MITCKICKDNIKFGQCIYMTDCNHIFHVRCLRYTLDKVWFNFKCPSCNKKLRKNRIKLLMMPMNN